MECRRPVSRTAACEKCSWLVRLAGALAGLCVGRLAGLVRPAATLHVAVAALAVHVVVAGLFAVLRLTVVLVHLPGVAFVLGLTIVLIHLPGVAGLFSMLRLAIVLVHLVSAVALAARLTIVLVHLTIAARALVLLA